MKREIVEVMQMTNKHRKNTKPGQLLRKCKGSYQQNAVLGAGGRLGFQ